MQHIGECLIDGFGVTRVRHHAEALDDRQHPYVNRVGQRPLRGGYIVHRLEAEDDECVFLTDAGDSRAGSIESFDLADPSTGSLQIVKLK
jgi:hypothetical protein